MKGYTRSQLGDSLDKLHELTPVEPALFGRVWLFAGVVFLEQVEHSIELVLVEGSA